MIREPVLGDGGAWRAARRGHHRASVAAIAGLVAPAREGTVAPVERGRARLRARGVTSEPTASTVIEWAWP